MSEETTEVTTEETTTEATPTELPQPAKVNAAFVVVLNPDGSMSTTSVKPGSPIFFEVEKATTTYDIFTTCKEIVEEIQSQISADRIAKAVAALLQPKDDSEELKKRLLNALEERKSNE
mgnify:CR=1 FL=1